MAPSLGAGTASRRQQPESRGYPALSGMNQINMVRAEGVEPSRAVKLNGFSYRLRLSPPDAALGAPRQVCGLDYPFTVPRKIRGLGAARLVSTPSRLERSRRAWLGIAMSQVSPNLGSSASPVSRRALKFCLKSVASASSATPAWLAA